MCYGTTFFVFCFTQCAFAPRQPDAPASAASSGREADDEVDEARLKGFLYQRPYRKVRPILRVAGPRGQAGSS